MTLDIVIPSFNRKEKLLNCLASIVKAKKLHYDVEVYVYFNDQASVEEFATIFPRRWINYRIVENYKVPEFWNTHLKDMHADMLMYCNDDVAFFSDTLLELFSEYPIHFPKLDGIMGICQANALPGQALDSAFGVIGKNYANKFPNKKVWCPDYYRFFCDQELLLYAKSINKFIFSDKVKIKHYHPAFTGQKPDNTHYLARKYLGRDKMMFIQRQSQGLLWGKSFKMLGGHNAV